MYHYIGCGRDRRRCGFCGRDGVFAHTISPTKTFRNGNPFVKEHGRVGLVLSGNFA
jgi:hypothetical protein